MIFFHGTTKEAWNLIQQEGVLWGKHGWDGKSDTYRYTYLTADRNIAIRFGGGILLKVEYTPKEYTDNYREGDWQFSVFDPIPLSKITLVGVNK